MKFLPWTRAFTRALTLLAAATAGLAFGAAWVAGWAEPRTTTSQVYAHAALSGYASAHRGIAAPAVAKPHPTGAPFIRPSVTPTGSRANIGPGALNCLAAAIYYEARGENAAGRAAVAQVVLNRARGPGYPRSICAVVYQGADRDACQFSFACNGATKGRREQDAWADARRVAARALRGYVMAKVGAANCFHAVRGDEMSLTGRGVRLGRQVFYTSS